MIIEKYKNYLTNKEHNRYDTFIMSRDLFNKINGSVILELGTTRSFVNGDYPGCLSNNTDYWDTNSPEKWDWGAGIFTRIFAEEYRNTNVKILTLDISSDHLYRCKIMVSEFNNVEFICSDSESFLKKLLPNSVDFIYQDTADCGEFGCLIHKNEAEIIIQNNILKPNGIILVDDHLNYDRNLESKAKYSLDIYKKAGFNILYEGKQLLLQKK